MAGIDTDLARNVARIQPLLALLLIASVALFFGHLVKSSAEGIVDAVQPVSNSVVSGALLPRFGTTIPYGGTATFRTNIFGGDASGEPYVTVVCFQRGSLVYQNVALQDATFIMQDVPGDGLPWGSGEAACTAALMYRNHSGTGYETHLLDFYDFLVTTR